MFIILFNATNIFIPNLKFGPPSIRRGQRFINDFRYYSAERGKARASLAGGPGLQVPELTT
jgi:hypothetical protein